MIKKVLNLASDPKEHLNLGLHKVTTYKPTLRYTMKQKDINSLRCSRARCAAKSSVT